MVDIRGESGGCGREASSFRLVRFLSAAIHCTRELRWHGGVGVTQAMVLRTIERLLESALSEVGPDRRDLLH